MPKASASRAEAITLLRKLLEAVASPFAGDGPAGSSSTEACENIGRSSDELPKRSASEFLGARTTVMVHNIPTACSPEHLLEVLPMDGSYDLLYAPMESSGRRLAGFAFLNFVSEAHAADFMCSWHGAHWPWHGAGRRLKVVWSRIQGLPANKEHLRETGGRSRKARQSGLVIIGGTRRSGVDGL